MPGPVPKPESQLQRPRERKGSDQQATTFGVRQPVTKKLPASDKWGEFALHLYDSLSTSGQADFYQDSDWAMAWFACDEIDDYLSGQRGAMKLSAILGLTNTLLFTEGDRRRVRMELAPELEEKTSLTVVGMDAYKDARKAVKPGV